MAFKQVYLNLNIKHDELGTTIMFLNFRTDRARQTVKTHIRLLLEDQSDQGLYCSPFRRHFLTHYSMVEPLRLNFRVITAIFQVSEILGFFTVFDLPTSIYALS